MKVTALTSRCIGSGSCVLACSQVFTQRESDGVVELLQERPPLQLVQQVRRAVADCPAQVFVVEQADDLSVLTLAVDDQEL